MRIDSRRPFFSGGHEARCRHELEYVAAGEQIFHTSRRAVLPQMAVEARLPLVAPAWMVAAMATAAVAVAVAAAVGDAAVQAQASSFIILSP